ncbi:hypothetical protein [Mesorhizobium sp.]|uniref:hypothetical protein n=1 Tax=Mesorhizobium sp. TaxID=1871066 RepID=UPI000FE97833|nr:hypothetical protein [Mesorhizobium sp.]RWF71865.1 MAG: hypothetical protein EOQ34_13910 [Mesorhizobium sp.]TIN03881.1 MAG: hypothetical protein E5Y38_06375 [Mesorhizobium sp.]TIQ95486.1 MAG: hypothetical protein E5X36_21810 [Mesorhizobium sp.]
MGHSIVPLTRDHLIEWYGDKGRGPTVRGIAGLVDGKLVAVAGLWYSAGNVIAFCSLKDGARPYRHAIHRTALSILSEAKARHKRIMAVCDRDEITSAKWLTRLGFKPDDGDVWIWQTSD